MTTSCCEDKATLESDLSAQQVANGETGRAAQGKLLHVEHTPQGAPCASGNAQHSRPRAQATPEAHTEPPGSRPSLDSLETTLENNAARHFAPYNQARRRLIDALDTHPDLDNLSLQNKLITCGSDYWVYADTSGYRVYPSLCRERACPVCQHVRSQKLRKALDARIASFQRPKFVTLTLQHLSPDFPDQLALLRRAFVRLRSHPAWTAKVRAGCWVLEYTLDPDGYYHLHLHIVIDSEWFPQDQLANLWTWATYETSCIVWIERVTTRTAAYMAKYLSKSSCYFPAGLPLHRHLSAIRHHRFTGAWKSPKPVLDQQLVLDPLVRVGRLADLCRSAAYGDTDSQHILSRLAEQSGLPCPYPDQGQNLTAS